ncbi:MAG: hypothetical protein CVU05_03515 [Bacteroidetes bacterium HGW-Bacteroidetes-21]|jgi:RNA polymerase sigma factor (sigma-70 family)|nr:MAG: hypothetical protein CVU05_03515 [Bacteroidetes bacterium HGW-Bacteroidetes-21]
MSRVEEITNDVIIEGIRTKNSSIISYIYKNYYPIIENIILTQYHGSVAQAKDIFQDALLTVYTATTGEVPLKINYTFITFLSTICKRRMIDEIRKSKKETREIEFDCILNDEPNICDLIIEEDKVRLFEKHFTKLGEKCREILSMFLEGLSIKEITCKLNMSSDQFTKKRRLQCKISLFKRIFEDPTLKELINGKPWSIREIPRW